MTQESLFREWYESYYRRMAGVLIQQANEIDMPIDLFMVGDPSQCFEALVNFQDSKIVNRLEVEE